MTKVLQRPTLILDRNWQPVRPTWRPLYADHEIRIRRGSKFISKAYWKVTLRQ